MIGDFFFEKIPQFFIFIYNYICQSNLYRILGNIWHSIKRAFSNCLLGRFCAERPDNKKSDKGLFVSVIDAITNFIVKIFSIVINALTFGTNSCILSRICTKLKELYAFLDYEFVCGISIVFIFLCPSELWHNIYGLLVSLFLLFVLIVLCACKKRETMSFKRTGIAFVAFIFTTLMAIFASSDKAESLRILIFFGTSFILAIIIAADITDIKKLTKILGFIYVAVIVTGFYAIYQRIIGVEISSSLTDLGANTSMPGRVFSTFENPNNYAEILILTMPLCAAYCALLKNKMIKRFAILFMAVPFVALLMTYSRSCWISFALTLFVFIFFYNKKLIPIVLVIGIACIPLLPSTILDRIGTIGSTSDSSNMYRIYIWEGVLRMLKQYWYSGVGLGPANFRAVYVGLCNSLAQPAPHSHMLYMEIWVEQGIIGLLSYFAMIISAFRRGILSIKYADKATKIPLIASLSALVGIMFACCAEYIWYYPRVMLVYFIVLGILYACINIVNTNKTNN